MSGTTSNLGITGVGQISIIVHDLPRATAFYRDALGLPLLFTAGNLAFFDCGGGGLLARSPAKPGAGNSRSLPHFPGSRKQPPRPPPPPVGRANRDPPRPVP